MYRVRSQLLRMVINTYQMLWIIVVSGWKPMHCQIRKRQPQPVLMKELVSRFGVPIELHSDQKRNFESEVFQKMCVVLGIRKTRTTALHPQSDGLVERMNWTISNHLSIVVSDRQRLRSTPPFIAYRSAVHKTTGQSPANFLFGRQPRLLCDLNRIQANIQDASGCMKERYDVNTNMTGN